MTDADMRDYVSAIASCDTTDAEIKRLQVSILHGGILTKDEKLLTSRILGVLAAILEEARRA